MFEGSRALWWSSRGASVSMSIRDRTVKICNHGRTVESRYQRRKDESRVDEASIERRTSPVSGEIGGDGRAIAVLFLVSKPPDSVRAASPATMGVTTDTDQSLVDVQSDRDALQDIDRPNRFQTDGFDNRKLAEASGGRSLGRAGDASNRYDRGVTPSSSPEPVWRWSVSPEIRYSPLRVSKAPKIRTVVSTMPKSAARHSSGCQTRLAPRPRVDRTYTRTISNINVI